MKRLIIVMAITVCSLSACGERPPQAVSAPSASAGAASQANPPLVVDETKFSEFDVASLGKAAWTGKACDLKTADGKPGITIVKGSQNVLEGYVIDPGDVPPGAFDFVMKGDKSFRLPVSTGWPRPDVAEFFKVPGLAAAGFKFSASFDAVPAGTYEVDFVINKADGTYFCESGKSILVQ